MPPCGSKARMTKSDEAGGMESEQAANIFSSGNFADLGLASRLSDHIRDRLGFEAPTRIQQAAIPIILGGKDVLVKAGTGTGKTLAYLASIVHFLQASKSQVARADGTLALVLVPTRELCLQVHAVAEQLVQRFIWLVPGCVMGGENRAKEKARLRKGITILVATPGRLLDHLRNTACFRHDLLRWLIFDEVDRLLDMGFKKDMEDILSLLDSGNRSGQRRQHLLLSATLNDDVNKLATLSLKDPVVVSDDGSETRSVMARSKQRVGTETDADIPTTSGGDDYCIPEQLQQKYVLVPCRLRLIGLLSLLQYMASVERVPKLVIFFSTCDSVDFHFSLISEFRWSFQSTGKSKEQGKAFPGDCFRLHGNMDQKERSKSYMEFGRATAAVLLCTDVAARGLDFQDVTSIVQFDPPGDAADYVHRVGRTARLGRDGEALLFLQPREAEYKRELQEHGVTLKELTLTRVLNSFHPGTGKHKKGEWRDPELHPSTTAMQQALELFISKKRDLARLAVDAFRSYVRAYAVHRGGLKLIFHVRNLHLGHVAKSFGLADAPSLLGQSSNKLALKRERKEQHKSKKKRKLTPAVVSM